jgi:hypothetical protein
MENESMTLPTSVMLKYFKPVFIETGTYDGRTVQQALDNGFEKVFSIESDPGLFQITELRFEGNEKVSLLFGESCLHLGPLLTHLSDIHSEAPLFWLDAHVQENFQHGKLFVPIMEELDIISKFDIAKNSNIMIDDMRLLGKAPGWENITSLMIINALLKINKDFVIVYEDSKAAPLDIMVAYPRKEIQPW